MDVQVAVIRVHLVAEHAAEFELFEDSAQTVQLGGHVINSALIIFFDRHVEQVARVGKSAIEVIDGFDNLRQGGAFTAQALGVFRLVPDVGVFEFAVYFDETIMLLIVVKDTPELTGCARTGP
ncbi:MAG: hypothetical protein JL55_22885 [Pseudomonas sp. BICA1-14]|nr:MAG: hypothetical protein JL55_22885 [[Pseudomonas] sp. BICA1-14]